VALICGGKLCEWQGVEEVVGLTGGRALLNSAFGQAVHTLVSL